MSLQLERFLNAQHGGVFLILHLDPLFGSLCRKSRIPPALASAGGRISLLGYARVRRSPLFSAVSAEAEGNGLRREPQ